MGFAGHSRGGLKDSGYIAGYLHRACKAVIVILGGGVHAIDRAVAGDAGQIMAIQIDIQITVYGGCFIYIGKQLDIAITVGSADRFGNGLILAD